MRLTLTLGRPLGGGGRDRRPFSQRGLQRHRSRQLMQVPGIHPSYASALDDRLLGLDC
jgi:hypothetical protein